MLPLKRLFRRILPLKTEHIRITIEELSQIWLKYNQPFQPQPEEPQIKDEEILAEVKPQEILTTPQRITTIFDEIIEPYREALKKQNVIDGLYKIVELLNEHGSCPSIVTTSIEKDSESDEIYSVRDILLNITLKDHSFMVAKIGLQLLKETYKDYEPLVPKMLVAAISHDIGKIPALRESGLYAKADHPLISASKVADIFAGMDIIWLNSVIEAIKDHHRQSSDPFTLLLKKADSKAREIEISSVSKNVSIKEWDEWFDVNAFLAIIRPEINVIQTGNRWRAFSFGGVVYCQPELLYESAKTLALNRQVIDMTLLRAIEREVALRKIVGSLRTVGVIINDLEEGYYGRFYEIQMEKLKKKMFLTPLKIEAFGTPSDIERVKEGYLQIIKKVNPAGR